MKHKNTQNVKHGSATDLHLVQHEQECMVLMKVVEGKVTDDQVSSQHIALYIDNICTINFITDETYSTYTIMRKCDIFTDVFTLYV